MEEEISNLNKVLRSLVVSTPTDVDVRSLLKDYKNMMGSHLPFAKFGYKDPITFLKEKCSESFVLQGNPSNPSLILIQNESIKHIDKFVQKQRITSSAKCKGKRRSVPDTTVRPPEKNLASKTFANQSLPVTQERNHYQCQGENSNLLNHKLQSKPTSYHAHNGQNDIEVKKTKYKSDNTNSKNKVLNICKNSKTRFGSQQSVPTATTDHDKDSREDDDSGRLTSSSSSSNKITQLEELRHQIREIIDDHPDGVWATDLLELYRDRYHRELNFIRFGFTSVVSLACSVEHVRAARQPSGDWLLSDSRTASSPRALNSLASRYHAPLRPRLDLPVDPEDALPGIPYASDVFPEDCINCLESIPAVSLADVESGAMLEVIVGEVYSPSHFWLLRLGDDYNIAMENMMDEMNKYYNSEEGRTRQLALGAVRVGHYCSSLYDGDWHRSIIVKIVDSDTVKVRHVDYGTVERVSTKGLRPLLRRFTTLAAQAFRARLGCARPPAAGRRWPRLAAHYFLRLVQEKKFVANVVAVDPEDGLEVLLIDTSTDEDRCISEELVRSGHAEPRTTSAHGTSECYLLPTFDALETAATPNFGEIYAYLRDGINPDFVEEYRLHVATCLPEQTSSSDCPYSSDTSMAAAGPSPCVSPLPLYTRIPLQSCKPTETPEPPSPLQLHPSSPKPECFQPLNNGKSYTPRCLAPPPPRTCYPPYYLYPQQQQQFQPPTPPTGMAGVMLNQFYHYAPRHPIKLQNIMNDGVSLSPGECEAFMVLSSVDPVVAQKFILEKMSQINISTPHPPQSNWGHPAHRHASLLDTHAAEFKMVTTETQTNILTPNTSFSD